MKYLTILLLLTFSIKSFSVCPDPIPATIVIKNPEWAREDEIRIKKEMIDRANQYARTVDQLNATKEHLKTIKDATKKLMEVNRRVANYRYLEMALANLEDALQRVNTTMKTLSENNCFSPTEYRKINESVFNLLGQTTFTIQAITVVVTDNFSSMTDGERLSNLQESIKQLRDDVGIVNNFLIEIETLNTQRMQIQTLQYFINTLKAE